MKTQVHIIKTGSGILDDPQGLSLFLHQFKALKGLKILVHGGGDETTRLALKLQIPSSKIDGRRITDAATLELITMVCAGKINKNLVVALQGIGVPSIGLCGADGNLVQGKKRETHPIDFGFVADLEVKGVNILLLQTLLNAGMVPVIAPLVHDGSGQLLNANADGMAKIIAMALSESYEVQLIFGFGLAGMLRDVTQEDSKIDVIRLEEMESMKSEGYFSGGMLPKMESAAEAVRHGVQHVRIADLKQLHQLETHSNYGTKICK